MVNLLVMVGITVNMTIIEKEERALYFGKNWNKN
jgi:hypothetical protein